MKCSFFVFAIFFLVSFGSSPVIACSCSDPSLRQRFRSSDSVFVGEVVDFKDRDNSISNKELDLFFYQVTFKVEKQWKGKRQPQITALASYDQPGWCGDLDLSIGKRILVFAPKSVDQLLIYRDCGPNRYAESSKKEIGKLNDPLFKFFSVLYPFPKL